MLSALHIWPTSRITQVLIGAALGKLLQKHLEKPFQISRTTQLLCCALSMLTFAVITFWPISAHSGRLPPSSIASLHHAAHPVAYGVIFAWIIFALATGNAPVFSKWLSGYNCQVMAKLSYMIYLVHPLVITMNAGRAQERVYWSHYDFAANFVWITFLSIALSVVLNVFVVKPVECCLKMILFRVEVVKVKKN